LAFASCARGVDDSQPATPPAPVVDAADAGTTDAAPPDAGPAWPVPAKMADRVGVYAWGFDDRAFANAPDRLSWAAEKVRELGTRTIRVYIGPSDPYKLGTASPFGDFSLTDEAKLPAYAALFANASFETYLLTTYTKDDEASVWQSGYPAPAALAERKAIADLATYLAQTYPTKTFIFLNWEGDNAIAPFASNAVAWDGFAAWAQARADGVKDARGLLPSAKVFSALEVNAACDDKCVASVVVPKVDVDYVSYSSWASSGEAVDTGAVAAKVQADLDKLLAFAKKKDPKFDKARVIVGELGALREAATFGECTAAKRIAASIGALAAWGAAYGVFWQVIDNAPSDATPLPQLGFGAFKADLSPTLAGATLHALFTTETPTVPSSVCPAINQGGVVDGQTFKPPIRAGATLSIFGDGFSTTAEVHVDQGKQVLVVSDGSPWFYRSDKQINFTLPASVAPNEKALVFVRNGTGTDSNGQYLDVTP
jgi:hypothetical protein